MPSCSLSCTPKNTLFACAVTDRTGRPLSPLALLYLAELPNQELNGTARFGWMRLTRDHLECEYFSQLA
jgi:hypothetical protein